MYSQFPVSVLPVCSYKQKKHIKVRWFLRYSRYGYDIIDVYLWILKTAENEMGRNDPFGTCRLFQARELSVLFLVPSVDIAPDRVV